VKDRASMEYIIASNAGFTSAGDITIWLQIEELNADENREVFGIMAPGVARALLINLQKAFGGLEDDRLRRA
jgi:hypothetical protein